MSGSRTKALRKAFKRAINRAPNKASWRLLDRVTKYGQKPVRFMQRTVTETDEFRRLKRWYKARRRATVDHLRVHAASSLSEAANRKRRSGTRRQRSRISA